MATGANSTPIKKLHPIMAAKEESNTPLGSKSALKNPELQAHLEAAKRAASQLFTKEEQPTTKKIRRSRWGAEQTRTVLPGLPTILPSNMSEEQRKLYLIHLQVEDISRRLRIDDLGIPINPLDRSPSPEPLYSHDGKRLNTREMRARKKMEDKRHELVQLALTMNPNYHPPIDYRAPTKKFEDKIFIPQDANPQTNFVGLLIGPRGVTLKNMEKETNCKIMIRGKGASKEGKFRGIPQPGEDEELHALVSASSPDDLKKAVDKIKGIIQSGIDNPGNDNDLKKQQMMQLAELNGTFRPIDILRCNNCGASTHRTWECPEGQNITSTVICSKCGSGGHIASDCKVVITSDSQNMSYTEKAKMDSEYQSLMKELGEKVPENKSGGSLFANDSMFGNKGAAIPPPGPLMPCENPHGVTVHGTPWVATAMPLPLSLPAVPILGPDGTWVAPINPFAPVPVVQTAPSPPPQSHNNNNKEQQPFPWGGPPPAPVNGVPTPSSAPTPLMAAPPLPPPDKNGPPPPPPMPMEPPPPPPPM